MDLKVAKIGRGEEKEIPTVEWKQLEGAKKDGDSANKEGDVEAKILSE